jgi:Nitrile hydratase, alpha chain
MISPLSEGWVYRWEPIVGRAWTDEAFKRRLLADPAGVLKEHGVKTSPGVKINVVENDDRLIHLTIPTKPDRRHTREEIDQMVDEKLMEHELWGAEAIQLTVEAAHDETLKKRLLADPVRVLQQAGLEVPSGIQIKVIENTETQYSLTLPAKPVDVEPADLSDEDLARVVGGSRIGGSIWYGSNRRRRRR